MAKPIEPTPVITGRDAVRILDGMRKEESSPNPRRIAFLRKCRETRAKWDRDTTKA